jgi:hypothetical protein
MAPDLIPPPSPAGQPDPDGGRVQRDDLVLPVRSDDRDEPVRDGDSPPVETPHRSRFGLIMGALMGLALASAVLLILTLASRDGAQGPQWSAWQPTSEDAYLAAEEIAAHVGPQYRLDDGSQLADVDAGPIEINDVPIEVVIRHDTEEGDILDAGEKGVWYVLNGLGERGSISRGTPSPERLALVKREALELALYTFQYVDGIDHVVALLPPAPPPKDEKSSSAAGSQRTAVAVGDSLPSMLFREGQLDAQLALPLALTLDPKTPTPSTIKKRDAELITQFTAPSTFNGAIEQSQIGEAFLVLDQRTTPPQLQGQISPTDEATKKP